MKTFFFVVLFACVYAWVSNMDFTSEVQEEHDYCYMVAHKYWPDFDDSIDCQKGE